MGTILLVAIAILAVALLLRPRGNLPGRSPRTVTTGDGEVLDSVKAADARRDWVTTLFWVERLGVKRPLDHAVLLARGMAWSNYAVDQRPGRVRPRPALRTSLERAECMRHALGLIDTSAMTAATPANWLDSGERLALIYETLGLSGDALVTYEMIKQKMPTETRPAMRAYWLRAIFYDPVHPDTSEWDRYMRSQGRR
jgi:hypothetical protein